ncbi:MAG: tetratricopeptide repeat protein [Bacteroidales bacterium]
MKRYLTISLLFLTLLLKGSVSPDSLFVHAGEAYTAGNFEQALDTYRSIVDHGYESAGLYYNMGNTAFRSNKIGYAVLYYEKALRLDPSHEGARKNLVYVSQYREDKLEQVPELFIRKWIRAVYQLFSLTTWSYLAILFFAALLAGILLYIFSSSLASRKAGFFTGMTALLFFLLSITASVKRNQEITTPERAVIVSPSVVVKSTPSLTGTDLFVLHEGTLIRLDERVGDWIEIRISDGRVGWITTDALAII